MSRGRLSSVAVLLLLGSAVLWAQPALARPEAYEALVIDARTGQVLESYNADARTYPASLTKMMTLYLTFEAVQQGRLKLNQPLGVSPHAAAQEPTKLDLEPGETITVEEAVLGLTVKSANDAAVVLAEALGGSEDHFAELMTKKAAQLGMTATHFYNASGLPDPDQVTTARDMAALARALIRDYPQFYHYFSAREFTFQGTTIPTHNHVLVNYDGADGLKTGYIHASGYNLVTSAVRDGRRLIGVVLGGRTGAARDRAMMRLLDSGFDRRAVVRQASYAAPAAAPASAAGPFLARAGAKDNDAKDDGPKMPAAAIAAVSSAPLGDAPGAAPAAAEPREAAAAPAGAAASTGQAPSANVKTAPALAVIEDDQAEERHPASHWGNRWGIQVGAYAHSRQAHSAALRVKHAFAGLRKATVSVVRGPAGRGMVYRARLTGISAGEAHAACGKIHRQRHECVILAPGNEHTLAELAH